MEFYFDDFPFVFVLEYIRSKTGFYEFIRLVIKSIGNQKVKWIKLFSVEPYLNLLGIQLFLLFVINIPKNLS